jgi:hypothetical protein
MLALLAVLALSGPAATAQEPAPDAPPTPPFVTVTAPAEGESALGKRPEIRAAFLLPVEAGSAIVMLDGADVTALCRIEAEGVTLVPPVPLAPGGHTLSVSAIGQDGEMHQGDAAFTSRHTRSFEEALLGFDPSGTYEDRAVTPENPAPIPFNDLQANLKLDARLRRNGFRAGLSGNARFPEQEIPGTADPTQPVELPNWTATVAHDGAAGSVEGQLGTVSVDISTLSLAAASRHGGLASLRHGIFEARAFAVESAQPFGFESGLGLSGGPDNQLRGALGALHLFGERLVVRTHYAQGAESPNSFGVGTLGGTKEGDVWGVALVTDFFQGRLRTELETDASDFDPDTSDEFGRRGDHAYLAKLSGLSGRYSYDAEWQRLGTDYGVVGNLGLLRDREQLQARVGATFGVHMLSASAQAGHDNLDENPLLARYAQRQLGLDWSYMRFPSLPLSLSYARGSQSSSREPADDFRMDLGTDTVTASANWMRGRFSLLNQAAYTRLDDRIYGNDSDSRSVTVAPGWTATRVAASGSLSYLRATGAGLPSTDTWTATLDVRTRLLLERLFFDLGGSLSSQDADDGSVDSRGVLANARLAYRLPRVLRLPQVTLALRGQWQRFDDARNPDFDKDDFTLSVVAALGLPLSF